MAFFSQIFESLPSVAKAETSLVACSEAAEPAQDPQADSAPPALTGFKTPEAEIAFLETTRPAQTRVAGCWRTHQKQNKTEGKSGQIQTGAG